MKNILVKAIMTTPPVSVESKTNLSEVIRILERNKISGVPVIDEGERVVGIISERDILKYTHWIVGQPIRDLNKIIGDEKEVAYVSGGRGVDMIEAVAAATAKVVMTENVVTVKEDTSVLEVVRLMNKNDINRVPVIDEAGRLTGVVSRANIMLMIEDWAATI